MKRLLFLFLILPSIAFSQDLAFGKKMVDTLASPYFWGRGYTNDGMKKAADFLAAQFESYGLKPLKGKSFFQSFTYPVNTFPGKMEVTINGKDLVPGKDFIVGAESEGTKAKGKLNAGYEFDNNAIMMG